jgi:hypothetical protein
MSIIVVNNSTSAINCFVSKYSNSKGDDSWFSIPPTGGRLSWTRSGWELVAFKNSNDTQRGGIYIPASAIVTFRSFGDIEHG